MKNKEESYENIFKTKYAQLKNDLEILVATINRTKDDDDFKIKNLQNEIENLKNNNIQTDGVKFENKLMNTDNLNKELKAELQKKIELIHFLKSESKNILENIQHIIENLTKKTE
jgi:hypothetical protein